MSAIRMRKFATKRPDGRDRSYIVTYRRGGAAFPLESAGTFPTKSAAEQRQKLVDGWLALGKDPKEELALLVSVPDTKGYDDWFDLYLASRTDHTGGTSQNVVTHGRKLKAFYKNRNPHTITIHDQIACVAWLSETLAPSSVLAYWATNRLVFDFADVKPNTARDNRVKLPVVEPTIYIPMSVDQYLALLGALPLDKRLGAVTMEQTAMAIGETRELQAGDVDVEACCFHVSRGTKGRGSRKYRARMRDVPVPAWLMEIIAARVAHLSPEQRVFPELGSESTMRTAIAKACRDAFLPHYHPHDLRHRRISVWHMQGVVQATIAKWAGHTKIDMSLGTYTHHMSADEASTDSLQVLLNPAKVMTP